ncbi:MAG: DUF4159 domain-containing protein [Verrucomicrobia bacterium]|nr:DUF4159 domain-containing protein [Verrucomicrobiota bacterium]
MKKPILFLLLLAVALAAESGVWAQRGFPGERARTDSRGDVPKWIVDPKFAKDVFTFVRVRYSSTDGGRGGYYRGERWAIDFPDADLNLAFRLQQMTSLKVHPDIKPIALLDEELADFPFIYIVEPGGLVFSDPEAAALRSYLLNGGFLMADDFWGERDWQHFYREIKRVFPDREPVELFEDHPIFSFVFPLKEKPQVPGIHHFYRAYGTAYESYERPDAAEVHYRAIFDDRGRMIALLCHNTDLGDGWEREGENVEYFRKYAETKAYPMAINIILYAMTH